MGQHVTGDALVPALAAAGLGLLAVAGDFFLKRAGDCEAPFRTGWFAAGLALYASTAFGSVYVFQRLKMAVVGAIYSVSFVLCLALLGALCFGEKLTAREAAGVGLALGALALLGRFA